MIKGKSQVILGFIFALIAATGLIIGVARIWVWFNSNYAKREVSYQQSRLSVARRTTPSYGSGATATESEYTKPLKLTDGWVFKGDTGDQVVGYASLDEAEWGESPEACRTACLAASAAGCGTVESFDSTCPCYTKCLCNDNIAPAISAMQQQVASLRGQAYSLRSAADNMRAAADRCSCTWRHPRRCFNPCSWGKTRKELRRGANQLDAAAAELDSEAEELAKDREKMRKCCDFNTEADQKACLDVIGQDGCNDLAGLIKADWQKQLRALKAERAQASDIIVEINSQIPACNSLAAAACSKEATAYANNKCIYCAGDTCEVSVCDSSGFSSSSCECTKRQWQAYYDEVYPGCYERERNACCQTFCYDGDTGKSCINDNIMAFGLHSCSCWRSKWGSACDAPATDCDLGGDSPACGLSVFASHQQPKIDNELTPAINALSGKMDSLLACCERPEIPEQMQCLSDLSREEGA